jgi:hypothetical protein
MSEFSTVILRFRDLNIDPGITIREHTAIASGDRGYVWWGWWNKSGETIPDDAFRKLALQAREKSFCLYLFDSGPGLVFQAICSDISWDTTHSPVLSPEPSATPAYYAGRRCLSWFKLNSITQCAAEELQKFSYVRVDNFFTSSPSRFGPFYGKRIFDVEELRQQDRTIWFVRPVQEADPRHQISLLDAHLLTPTDFPLEYATEQSCNVLWVSDLHFSLDDHHAFPLERTASQADLSSALTAAASKHGFDDLAAVIVSGDITWRADPTEFAHARRFFNRMIHWPSKLDPYRIALCPGNHDIAFSPTPADKTIRVADDIASERARGPFEDFYRDLFHKRPNQYLSSARRLLVGGGVPVEIVCLNSSYLEQRKEWFQGMGFVGAQQLEDAASSLGWRPAVKQDVNLPRPFRIVVLHHHLLPVTYRDIPKGGAVYSVTLDAEALTHWLVEHRVDLVLHGHMHQAFCARVARPLDGKPGPGTRWHEFHVVGMGSTGVCQKERSGPNVFGMLRFYRNQLTLSVLTVTPNVQTEKLWSLDIPLDRP